MGYYPVFLDLRSRPAVVVGGGPAAVEKVEGLVAAGARVTLVAPSLPPALAAHARGGRLVHRARPYRLGDLAGAFLAISVEPDPAVNEVFRREAEAGGVVANVMDDPPRCSFIAPAVVRRGDLVVAISTGGRAPSLAVRLREWLETTLGEEYARFLELAGHLREPLKRRWPELAHRRRLWYRLVDSEVLALLARGRVATARRRAVEILHLEGEVEEAGEGTDLGTGRGGGGASGLRPSEELPS